MATNQVPPKTPSTQQAPASTRITRSRKRFATSPIEHSSVGSASVSTLINLNPTHGTLSVSDTGSAPKYTPDKLLELRKKFHRTSSSITQINHHLKFIQDCVSYDIVPKGLQINIKPYAYLANETNIEAKFKRITEKAQASYLEALLDHYGDLQIHHQEELKKIQIELDKAETHLSPEVSITHKQLLEKTTENIEKKKKQLTDKATKKIEILRDPSKKPPIRKRNPRSSTSRSRAPQQQTRPATRPSSNRPTYATITSQHFQDGGPGQTINRTQPHRQPLLPNPTINPTHPPPQFQAYPPQPLQTHHPTTNQLLHTLTQILITLARGD